MIGGREMNLRRIFAAFALIAVLSIAGFYLYINPKYVVPILMYHHIDEEGGRSSLSVSPENFRRQMRFLSQRNYNVISLTEFVHARRKLEKLPRNTVVITFDDGYADNYFCAFSVLKQYNLTATIFVIVDAIGEAGYLSYAQLKEMNAQGSIEIGSHTLSGAYLPGRDTRELKREIGSSKRILDGKLNKPVVLFCYPLGGFTAEIQEIVRRSGYLAACSTNRGYTQTYLNDDIFALKRIKITDAPFNLFVFWAKLSGYYNLFRSVKKPH